MNNDPKVIIQSLNLENRQLRQQVAALQSQNVSRMLFEKLLCAALTGAVMKCASPEEASEYAKDTASAMIASFQGEPEQESATDADMNQRP